MEVHIEVLIRVSTQELVELDSRALFPVKVTSTNFGRAEAPIPNTSVLKHSVLGRETLPSPPSLKTE